ncbi:hypothetical protein C6W10_15255 [Plantactinospora sp. BB1]|nr:hypothetical protein C6W10_15255 [Plantactinospora sp. BB1]
MAQPARSAALRSTQNSLPSGSASTAQPVPSGRRWSATRVAPSPKSRSTSSSRVRSAGCRQMCSRFLPDLPSGTRWKKTCGLTPSGDSRVISSSPGWSSGRRDRSSTWAQKLASRYVSAQSKLTLWMMERTDPPCGSVRLAEERGSVSGGRSEARDRTAQPSTAPPPMIRADGGKPRTKVQDRQPGFPPWVGPDPADRPGGTARRQRQAHGRPPGGERHAGNSAGTPARPVRP